MSLARGWQRGPRILSYLSISFLIFTSWTSAQSDGIVPVQQTLPTCVGEWDLVDDHGLRPCDTLVEAMTSCMNGEEYILAPVTSEPLNLYPVPSGNTTTCECNEVMYNLFQACAACQQGADSSHLSSRQTWFAKCPQPLSQISINPPNFNETTFWVLQVYDPMFNVSLALNAESTGDPPPPASDSSSDGGSNPASTSAPSSNSSSKKSSNTPVIVGVVVGVIGLITVAVLLFLLFTRRKRSRTAPSKEFMQYAPVNQALIGPSHDEESAGVQDVQRHSAIRNDSGVTEETMEALPGFTPGLFKDPIFEKGVALNIASHSGLSGAAGSPVTYSPATPSTLQATHEQQRLIQSRQGSGS